MVLRGLTYKGAIFIAALSTLAPNAMADDVLPDPQSRQSIESKAENIAVAVYKLDYLDPGLAPALIQETVMNVIADTQLDLAEKIYLLEILDTWFATLPNISAAIAQTVSNIATQQTTSMPADALEASSGMSATEIPSIVNWAGSLSDLVSSPPTQAGGGNSDY